MNPLYHFRGLRNWGTTPHAAMLRAEAAHIIAQRTAKADAEARAARNAKRRSTLRETLNTLHTRVATAWRIASPAIVAICLAALLMVSTASDQKDATITKLTAERDQWQALATKSASDQLTINFTGNAGTVREQLRALARIER